VYGQESLGNTVPLSVLVFCDVVSGGVVVYRRYPAASLLGTDCCATPAGVRRGGFLYHKDYLGGLTWFNKRSVLHSHSYSWSCPVINVWFDSLATDGGMDCQQTVSERTTSVLSLCCYLPRTKRTKAAIQHLLFGRRTTIQVLVKLTPSLCLCLWVEVDCIVIVHTEIGWIGRD
jgi:hypothetical protein